VQRNACALDHGHVLDQQTNHALAFSVGQSRALPDFSKIGC
jgi:hypothetical protein